MISKGKILRLLRDSLNLRQDEVAARANISPGYLSLIENGKKEPSLEVLHALSEIYNVPFYLFVWNEDDLKRTRNAKERKIVESVNEFMEQLFLTVMKRHENKAEFHS
jgi:transcriptional regulator with XRE-family HTH domain